MPQLDFIGWLHQVFFTTTIVLNGYYVFGLYYIIILFVLLKLRQKIFILFLTISIILKIQSNYIISQLVNNLQIIIINNLLIISNYNLDLIEPQIKIWLYQTKIFKNLQFRIKVLILWLQN